MPLIHHSPGLLLSIALQASALWLAGGSTASAQSELIFPPSQEFPLFPVFSTEPVARPAQCEAAAEALGALETASVVMHSEIVEELKASGIQAMPEPRQALTLSSPQVSSAAVEVLGRFGRDAKFWKHPRNLPSSGRASAIFFDLNGFFLWVPLKIIVWPIKLI